MKIETNIVLTTIASMTLPLIVLFAVYIQMHGEITPGGGFQSGVILASAAIFYALVFGNCSFLKFISMNTLQALASIGVIIYASVGIAAIIGGGNFLDYSSFFKNNQVLGQELGVFGVELGVGLTVSSAMLVLYFAFSTFLEGDF